MEASVAISVLLVMVAGVMGLVCLFAVRMDGVRLRLPVERSPRHEVGISTCLDSLAR